MASIEGDGMARIRPLGLADLRDCVALSTSASWNQNENDWSMMLSLGQGWGACAADDDGRERLAASIVVLPYGTAFAWISMVLVLPGFRRRGLASLLLRHALADLRSRGMAGILDATPAGHAVYLEEGFADQWSFRRYRREAVAPIDRDGAARSHGAPSSAGSRALHERDWPAIAALDRPAFGADRTPLLRALARRLPTVARVAEIDGRIVGFVLGRDGREATQIGPLLAGDHDTARALLGDALWAVDGPIHVDLADRHEALLAWLHGRGFVFQRPFTRMVHGAAQAPGNPAPIVLVAGPELG